MTGKAIPSLTAMVAICLIPLGRASAQGEEPSVAALLHGYRCMMPVEAASRGGARPPSGTPPGLLPILAVPRSDGPRLGTVADAVIADDPLRVVNGYARVLLSDGRRGWVRRGSLRPWRTTASPGLRCLPALLSDGQRGFTFAHPG